MTKYIVRAWTWLVLFIIWGCASDVAPCDTTATDAGDTVALERSWSLYSRHCDDYWACGEWQIESVPFGEFAPVDLHPSIGDWTCKSTGSSHGDGFDEMVLWLRYEPGPDPTTTVSLRCGNEDTQTNLTLAAGFDQSAGEHYELILLCAVTEVTP